MRITEKKTITKEEVITKDILCNKCGNTCSVPFHRKAYYGLTEVKVSGGYMSTHLEDMVNYTFSLCEPCLKKLMDSFEIPAEVEKECCF